MLEDPAVAVERIYRELYARIRQITTANGKCAASTVLQ